MTQQKHPVDKPQMFSLASYEIRMKKLQTYLMLSFLCLWVPNAQAEDASVASV